MRKTWTYWIILASLTGCAVLPPDRYDPNATSAPAAANGTLPSTVDSPNALPAALPGSAVARIDANLERLRALHVVDVGQLILRVPEGAQNCYGVCPEDEPRARAEAAERLSHFADVAVSHAARTPADACSDAAVDSNLAALRALRLVEVNGLVRAEPSNNPNCYNLPCAEDIEAARQLTCERAGQLANIAAATRGL